MLEFILNNKTIKTAVNAGSTLLDYVRYEQRLTGTKIGCREGDCGACTVLVGTLQKDGAVSYQSITSCISPLGNAHGKHIVTVEGTNLNERLTAAQQAMKENYATQCGFCTPGFVVALTGFALTDGEKTTETALDAISGNICRCTGYKSIEKATAQICEGLKAQDSGLDLEWLIENDFIPAYFKDIPKKLSALNSKKAVQSGTAFVSGGTDLYVQKADALIESTVHLIAEDDSLKGINIDGDTCVIGAGATVSDLWNNKALNSHFPNLKKHLKLVSSEQIRNMASLGGNFVNASPIGDMTIFFLALNSSIRIADNAQNEREIQLSDFYKGYKTYDLNAGETIRSIHFKLPNKATLFNFEKVSKRTHLDIASVNSAINLSIVNNTVQEAHVSVGGVAAIPKYLGKTSAFLKGKTLNTALVLEANSILQEEIAPISDVRGAADYKRLLARQLFYAHFTELLADQFKLTDFVQ